MAKWKKIITAGGMTREAIYPAINSRSTPQQRQGQRKLSSEAQRRMNDKYMWQKLEMLLAANYRPGDLVVTLTYRPDKAPRGRKEAEARLKYFRAKLSRTRKQQRRELVMFWCTEHKHGYGAYHHHCIINATGSDYRDIVSAWGLGEVEITRLEVSRDRNFESLARYMTKEARDDGRERVGLRAFSYTRNALKPQVETFRVDDDTTLQAPKGAVVFNEDGERTMYGSYRYIKYYLDGSRAPRSRRRRR